MIATIVGAQLGDEGKGAVVDHYSDHASVTVRYQGGDNAGHTVVEDGAEYKLSLVPSGAVRGKTGVLGNGCVINPRVLFSELETLRDRGLEPDLRVARRAHVVFPYHRVLDTVEEAKKADEELAAGTTGRGIGPAYEDKVGRHGIRIGDLVDPAVLESRLSYTVGRARGILEGVYGRSLEEVTVDGVDVEQAFDATALFEEFREYGKRLREQEMVVDSGTNLTDRLEAGENVLLEGAQGTSLDIDHGIYPFVTSSNTTAGNAATGTGLPVTAVGEGAVIGVVKAYLSRVGTGPLPTELDDVADAASADAAVPTTTPEPTDQKAVARYLRGRGGEYGTVTGRPRRVGWLDMPMLRQAAQTNGFTGLAVNHLDVLAGLDEIKVAHAYEHNGTTELTMPATTEAWGECTPVYRRFDGWPDVDWSAVAEEGYDALPEATQTYLEYITEELDAPLYAVGVGPDRTDTIVRQTPFGPSDSG